MPFLLVFLTILYPSLHNHFLPIGDVLFMMLFFNAWMQIYLFLSTSARNILFFTVFNFISLIASFSEQIIW